MSMPQTAIDFSVEVENVGEMFGVTLFVSEDEESEQDDEVQPCYMLVFRGNPKVDVDDVARMFSSCHQLAMESVGLEGEITEEQFSERLDDSVELAGELMIKHGFVGVDRDDCENELWTTLFGMEEDLPESDPKLLN